jgi:peptidyl-prolyl cis-trans isomerase A (cyclophilin A)
MRHLWQTIVFFMFLGTLIFGGGTKNPRIVLKTEFGNIEVEIYEMKAPITASNFLSYVNRNLFKDASFYRVVRMDNQPNDRIKIEVIQGGLSFTERENLLPPIKHETTDKTGILHKDGVISMARSDPGTASSEFFICVGDQPELDYGGRRNPDGQGFAAFGKVVSGMEVVKKIRQQSTEGQMLVSRVKIFNILRVE